MISVNFASRNYGQRAAVIRLLAAGSLLLLFGAAAMVWQTVSLRTELSLMQQKVNAARKADKEVEPALRERAQLVKNLNAMSGIIEARKFSWTGLLTSLETVVPIGVALQKIEFDPKTRSLSIAGVAQSPESLRNLVVGFEKSPSFREPFLKHQSVEKGSISFNVVAFYREQ